MRNYQARPTTSFLRSCGTSCTHCLFRKPSGSTCGRISFRRPRWLHSRASCHRPREPARCSGRRTHKRSGTLTILSYFFLVRRSFRSALGYFYFFSSFLGWHFSQTLPSLAPLTQHLWSHFFPASTVPSQQAANTPLVQKAKATAANTSDF